MSLFNTLVSSSANAMEGAAFGRAIGQARDRAIEAEERTDMVLRQLHAARVRVVELERYVRALEAKIDVPESS